MYELLSLVQSFYYVTEKNTLNLNFKLGTYLHHIKKKRQKYCKMYRKKEFFSFKKKVTQNFMNLIK